MEGTLELAKIILTKFTDETILIFSASMLFIFICLIAFWLYERKRFRDITRQIPASVVNSYLESIIQNSRALKSSLVGTSAPESLGVPSVYPLGQLPTNAVPNQTEASFPNSLNGLTPESVELNHQKDAEIAYLKAQMLEKEKNITELAQTIQEFQEGKNLTSSINEDSIEEISILREEIASLQEKLSKTEGSNAKADISQEELEALKEEKNEFELRLKEYAIIEEDLANLKKFQDENVTLKKEINELKEKLNIPVGEEEEEENPTPQNLPQPEPEASITIEGENGAKEEDPNMQVISENPDLQKENMELEENIVVSASEEELQKNEEPKVQVVEDHSEESSFLPEGKIIVKGAEVNNNKEEATIKQSAPTLEEENQETPDEVLHEDAPQSLDEGQMEENETSNIVKLEEKKEEASISKEKNLSEEETDLIKEFEKMIG